MALKQEGTVLEFRERFELIIATLKDVPEEVLVGAFKNGLKEEIKAEVSMGCAKTLSELMEIAHRVEEKNLVLERTKENRVNMTQKSQPGLKWVFSQPIFSQVTPGSEVNRPTMSIPAHSSKSNDTKAGETKPSHNISSASSVRPKSSVRRLSDAKLTRRRELGLCFKCEEKYGPNHRCRNKQLQILILEGEAENQEGEEEERPMFSESELTSENEKGMELSMNSIVGIDGNHTMKLVGEIQGEKVVVLIDSGATHNFISSDLVEKLSLPV